MSDDNVTQFRPRASSTPQADLARSVAALDGRVRLLAMCVNDLAGELIEIVNAVAEVQRGAARTANE